MLLLLNAYYVLEDGKIGETLGLVVEPQDSFGLEISNPLSDGLQPGFVIEILD